MDNTNLTGPRLGRGRPTYPVHLQLIRVTGDTVPGPTGGSSASGHPTDTLYVAYTQQSTVPTIYPRDREPCLVEDVNNIGLTTGYYLGRLCNAYTNLPVYEVAQEGVAQPFVSIAAYVSTTVDPGGSGYKVLTPYFYQPTKWNYGSDSTHPDTYMSFSFRDGSNLTRFVAPVAGWYIFWSTLTVDGQFNQADQFVWSHIRFNGLLTPFGEGYIFINKSIGSGVAADISLSLPPYYFTVGQYAEIYVKSSISVPGRAISGVTVDGLFGMSLVSQASNFF